MNTALSSRVWFITGAGRGLGRAFADAALAAGDRVVAAVRRPQELDAWVRAAEGRAFAVPLDVTERAAAFQAMDRAVAAFGRVDVVVNNAGYGLVGAIEELSEEEVRRQLDTNLCGAIWVTQAALPHMRTQGAGDIVQISSVGGVGTMPFFGAYNASKFALEGFSEALAAEVAVFGVRVTIVEPGSFATDWAWGSMRFAKNLPAYDERRSATFGTRTLPWDMGAQGADTAPDPARAAEALLAHLQRSDAPLRLLVGDDAPDHVRIALARRRDDYAKDPRFTWP